jgi:hypothetical protein
MKRPSCIASKKLWSLEKVLYRGIDNSMSRRNFNACGIGVAAGLAFPKIILGTQVQDRIDRHKKLLCLWQEGGMSQEVWNPKIGSPNVDAVFNVVRTNVPDLQICELFPRVSQVMNNVVLFRARYSRFTEHLEAMREHLFTQQDRTNFLTPLARQGSGLPQVFYAEVPNVNNGFPYREQAFAVSSSLELPWNAEQQRFMPPNIGCEPNVQQLQQRTELLNQIDTLGNSGNGGAQLARYDQFREQALQILRQSREISADLPAADLARYSGHETPTPLSVGLVTLIELFRRNIVNVALFRDGWDSEYGGWDQHTRYEERMRRMAPRTDAAYAALFDDFERGRLPENLTVYSDQEFGRTPRLNSSSGRDHYPWYSSWILSEQLQGGTVYGATNNHDIGVSGGVVNAQDYATIIRDLVAREPDFTLRGRYPFYRSR